MKRSGQATGAVVLLCALVAACSPGQTDGADDRASGQRWLQPPQAQAVVVRGDEIIIAGLALPEARVLAEGAGATHGANADGEGRFQLALPRPHEPTLLTVETQKDDLRARGAGRLLLTPDARAVLMTPGRPSRLLSAPDNAVMVDHDGRVLMVSGRATPGREVTLAVDGGLAARAAASGDGAYFLGPVPVGAGGHTLTVAALGERPLEIFIDPASSQAEDEIMIQSRPGVLSAAWRPPGGGTQRLWVVTPGR